MSLPGDSPSSVQDPGSTFLWVMYSQALLTLNRALILLSCSHSFKLTLPLNHKRNKNYQHRRLWGEGSVAPCVADTASTSHIIKVKFANLMSEVAKPTGSDKMLKLFPSQKGSNPWNSSLLSALQATGNSDAQKGTSAPKEETRAMLLKKFFYPR